MEKFKVNQKVRVIDKGSPHHGRIGTISVTTAEQDGVVYGLMFSDFKEHPKLPPIGRFKEDQLQAA